MLGQRDLPRYLQVPPEERIKNWEASAPSERVPHDSEFARWVMERLDVRSVPELEARLKTAARSTHMLLNSDDSVAVGNLCTSAIRDGDIRMIRYAWLSLLRIAKGDADRAGAFIDWTKLGLRGGRPAGHTLFEIVKLIMAGEQRQSTVLDADLYRPNSPLGDRVFQDCDSLLGQVLKDGRAHCGPPELRQAVKYALETMTVLHPSHVAEHAIFGRLLDARGENGDGALARSVTRAPPKSGVGVARTLYDALCKQTETEGRFANTAEARLGVVSFGSMRTFEREYFVPALIYRGLDIELLEVVVSSEMELMHPAVKTLAAHALVYNAIFQAGSWNPERQLALAGKLIASMLNLQGRTAKQIVDDAHVTPLYRQLNDDGEQQPVPVSGMRPWNTTCELACLRATRRQWTDKAWRTKYVPMLIGVPLLACTQARIRREQPIDLLRITAPVRSQLKSVLDSFDWPSWTLIAALEEAWSNDGDEACGILTRKLGERTPRRFSDAHAIATGQSLPDSFVDVDARHRHVLGRSLLINCTHFDRLLNDISFWTPDALFEALCVAIAVNDVERARKLLIAHPNPLPHIVPAWCKSEATDLVEPEIDWVERRPQAQPLPGADWRANGPLPHDDRDGELGWDAESEMEYRVAELMWESIRERLLGVYLLEKEMREGSESRPQRLKNAMHGRARSTVPFDSHGKLEFAAGRLAKQEWLKVDIVTSEKNLLLPFAALKAPGIVCDLLKHSASSWTTEELRYALFHLVEHVWMPTSTDPSCRAYALLSHEDTKIVNAAVATLLLAPYRMTMDQLPGWDAQGARFERNREVLEQFNANLYAPGGLGFAETHAHFSERCEAERSARDDDDAGPSSSEADRQQHAKRQRG